MRVLIYQRQREPGLRQPSILKTQIKPVYFSFKIFGSKRIEKAVIFKSNRYKKRRLLKERADYSCHT